MKFSFKKYVYHPLEHEDRLIKIHNIFKPFLDRACAQLIY